MIPTAITELRVRELDVALREPFSIATGSKSAARSLLVRVKLAGGAEGWGEAAPFEAVNGETREIARREIESIAPEVVGWDARNWRGLAPWLRERITRLASARCAVETALLDALCVHHGIPMASFFGGVGTQLMTDLTITTGTVDAAKSAATRIARDGFEVIKVKVGGVEPAHDFARLEAIVAAAPACGLLLDANASIQSVDDALELIRVAAAAGGRVVLYEQPMGRDDLASMREVATRGGVRVCADESVRSVEDVVKVAREGAAHVVNLKIMKSGLFEALDMATTAKALGLGLMVGGMVETSMAMTTSACLAAGLGGFEFVDLDIPLFLVDSPLTGGFAQQGPRLDLSAIRAGHGVRPPDAWLDSRD